MEGLLGEGDVGGIGGAGEDGDGERGEEGGEKAIEVLRWGGVVVGRIVAVFFCTRFFGVGGVEIGEGGGGGADGVTSKNEVRDCLGFVGILERNVSEIEGKEEEGEDLLHHPRPRREATRIIGVIPTSLV